MLKEDYPTVQALIAQRSIPEPNSGCWLWEGACDRDGYGRMNVRRRGYIASRASFEAFTGASPQGLSVMHSCDNPGCVNPDHLSVGTTAQNIGDAARRGRMRGPHIKTRRVFQGKSAFIKTVMVTGTIVDEDVLPGLVGYDPPTGQFRWLERPDDISWTTRYAGKSAGTISEHGKRGARVQYIRISMYGSDHYAHRLAWMFMNGPIPAGMEVDHINGDTLDNRIANLRLASHAQNGHNTGLRRNNKSGVKGVSWVASRQKWVATITENGKMRSLGRFEDFDDAVAARRTAEEAYHGSFAHKGAC